MNDRKKTGTAQNTIYIETNNWKLKNGEKQLKLKTYKNHTTKRKTEKNNETLKQLLETNLTIPQLENCKQPSTIIIPSNNYKLKTQSKMKETERKEN